MHTLATTRYLCARRAKNVREMHQRMMNKIFMEWIGERLEVYMEDMTVKSDNEGIHNEHLASVFQMI